MNNTDYWIKIFPELTKKLIENDLLMEYVFFGTIKKVHSSIFNYKSDGACYFCYFYSVNGHKTAFKKFSFTINYNLKKRIKEKIQNEGMKYYNHISLLDKNHKVIK